MQLRRLVATDAPAYRALRLRALREHPEAFGSSVEEEETTTLHRAMLGHMYVAAGASAKR